MAERLPPKSREPTSEVEVEPDTGQTQLPREPPRAAAPPRPIRGARPQELGAAATAEARGEAADDSAPRHRRRCPRARRPSRA